MERFAYISGITGAGNSRFYKILRDRKNGRVYDITAGQWGAFASVSSTDRKVFLSQGASPFLGEYYRELSGLGPVGELYEYTCDANSNSGRPFYGERRYISDGAFANTPATADTTSQGKARFEYIAGQAGLGPVRRFKRAIDHATDEIWDNQNDEWAPLGSISDDDSKIFLAAASGTPELDFANIYGTELTGMGSRNEIWLYDYDQLLNPNQPDGAERFRLVNGSVSVGGSLGPFKVEALKAHGVLTNVDRLDPDNEPDTIVTVNSRAAPTFLARIVDSSGAPLLAAAIASISASVYELRAFEPGYYRPIAGHYRLNVPTADALFDILQVNYLWSEQPDGTGYNFAYQPSIATSQAFPDRGKLYAIVFTFTPTTGEVFDFRFIVKTKA